MSTQKLKKILIAPLDWGLGHTSRCTPLIRHLQDSGHKVVFAGCPWQIDFIYKIFPVIETIHLEGYNVSYARSAHGFMPFIMLQVPKILSTIRSEHQWLINLCKDQHFDAIISDNRYGLYHPRIPSAIMTHQLHVLTGNKLSDNIFARLHYKMLQHFTKCMVVDVPGNPNLSGQLAHPKSIPHNAEYIGLLSQFEKANETKATQHLLILLSGPEPQRSILSGILWQQVQDYKGNIVFVEGSNDATTPSSIPAHIQYHKRIAQNILQPIIEQASLVICRSGYSSLMDLIALNKKAIIIPTPGQTEQEYLAKHLHSEGVFYAASQKNFNLSAALQNAATFPFKKLSIPDAHTRYKAVIDNWLLSLPANE